MITINPEEIPVAKLHGYLLGGVAPRPIALVSSIDDRGNVNLSPFSFFNVFGANPPIAIFSPARRVRNNTIKHTLENAKEVHEVVINAVTYDMVQQVSLSSTEYPKGVNEFKKAGLTELPSEVVKPPRVKESPFQLECSVEAVYPLGEEGGAGNLVVCQVLRVHIDERILNDQGQIDPQKARLVGRLGGNWYCKAFGDALFEVEKPLRERGIGVDNIPAEIRNSKILTGNNLGQLGNIAQLPDETSVNEYKLLELSDLFQEYENAPEKLEEQLHLLAKRLLEENKVEEAWKVLLSFNYN